MSVKKIFVTLIVVVACVIIGALVLNILLPNTATALVDAVEDQIYNATGMSFDLNGNGAKGAESGSGTMKNESDNAGSGGTATGISGFKNTDN